MRASCPLFLFYLILCIQTLFAIPIVTHIHPHSDSISGGTKVHIHGSGFREGVTHVLFGNVDAEFFVKSDRHILAIAPANVPSIVDVTVSTLLGVSETSIHDIFKYHGAWNAITANSGSNNASPVKLPQVKPLAPITVGTQPRAIGITPDGLTGYVLNFGSNDVTVIDIPKKTASSFAPIPVGTNPYDIAITPDGKTAFIANSGSNDISAIDTETNSVVATITVGTSPRSLGITPNGKLIFVPNFTDDTISVIDVKAKIVLNQLLIPLPAGSGPIAVRMTPNGKNAYIVNFTANTITRLNLRNLTLGPVIPVGLGPVELAITPSGKKAYAINSLDNTITPIHLWTRKAKAAIPVGVGPTSMAIRPDGKWGYVVNSGSNDITPVHIEGNKSKHAISLGFSTSGVDDIAIVPDQAPFAWFKMIAKGTSGRYITFDASRSKAATGHITHYKWHFGDGTKRITSHPRINHKYKKPGVYNIRLDLVTSNGTATKTIFTGKAVSHNGTLDARATNTLTIP